MTQFSDYETSLKYSKQIRQQKLLFLDPFNSLSVLLVVAYKIFSAGLPQTIKKMYTNRCNFKWKLMIIFR